MKHKQFRRQWVSQAKIDILIDNIGELLSLSGAAVPRGGIAMGDVAAIYGAAVAVRDGKVAYCGAEDDVLARVDGIEIVEHVDAGGRLVSPGFIDPHTHSVFTGRREDEFEKKVSGVSYREIAEAGGGYPRDCETGEKRHCGGSCECLPAQA